MYFSHSTLSVFLITAIKICNYIFAWVFSLFNYFFFTAKMSATGTQGKSLFVYFKMFFSQHALMGKSKHKASLKEL